MDLTIGGRGDRYAGYIRLGNSRCDADISGVFLYDGGRHHRRPHRYYGHPHYFDLYRPFRYDRCAYYEPWYGYTYATAYFHTPYAYRVYDRDVYYVNETYIVDGSPDAAETTVIMVPSEPADAPTDVTVIEQTVVPYTDGGLETETVMIDQDGSELLEPIEAPAPVGDAVSPPATGQPAPQDVPLTPLTEPTDATWVGKGNTAFMDGRYDEARRCYISAVMADERDGYAKFLYALANFAVGDFKVGSVAMRRALLTTADLIEYPVDIRTLYSDPMVLDSQLETLTRFIAAHSDNADARLLLGYLYYASGDPARALAVLEPAVAAHGDDELMALLRDAVLRVTEGSTVRNG